MDLFKRYGKILIITLMVVALMLTIVIVNMIANGRDMPHIFGTATDGVASGVGTQGGISRPEQTGTITTTTEATTVEPTETRVSFIAVGDNIVHECVYLDAMTRAETAVGIGSYNGKYYFDSMYAGVASLISSADIAFVNFEAPIAGDSFGVRGYPNFNAPAEAGEAVVRLGFDVINLANNHILDMENITTGYKNTIEFWKTQPVVTVGAYTDGTDMDKIRVIDVDGIKVAMLAFTYGTNVDTLNKSTATYIIPLINDDTIRRQITAAKAVADLVFVSMHWGVENKFPVTAEQERQAKFIADCGADVIIGHHPHVIQKMEWIDGASGNRTLCVYSLGNFISTQLQPYNMVGGMVSLDLVRQPGGKAYIDNVRFIPTVCHYSTDKTRLDSQGLFMRHSVQLFRLDDYTEGQAASHGAQAFVSAKFTLATLKGYVSSVISSEFLGGTD